MPSPKSRAMNFYYGHPQNIFWQTLAQILEQEEPERDVEKRKQFVLRNHIALWDVLASCEIKGASDASICNIEVNDFQKLLAETAIEAIFTTGKTATQLFQKHCEKATGKKAIYLSSTSPANRAQQKKPEFMQLWQRIKEFL